MYYIYILPFFNFEKVLFLKINSNIPDTFLWNMDSSFHSIFIPIENSYGSYVKFVQAETTNARIMHLIKDKI